VDANLFRAVVLMKTAITVIKYNIYRKGQKTSSYLM